MKQYSSYKDSGIAWIGQIPSHWEMRKMKFCFNERVDKNHPLEVKLSATQTNGVIPQTMYEGQGNRVVNVNTGFETLKLVKVGDFVIHLRSFQGGIEYAYYQGIISPAYTILEPQNPNYTGFYKFLFKSYPYIQLLKTCVTGIREGQNIDYKILGNKYIPIPPADEQEAIVRFITEKSEKIDRYIAEQERLLAALDELRAAEIARAVTRGLNPDAPLRDSGIQWIGQIPEHWDVCKLGFLFSHNTGKALKASDTKGDLRIYITTSNVYWDTFVLDNLRQMYFTKDEIEKCQAIKGDLLICEGGDVGRAAIWNSDTSIMIQNHLHKLRPIKELVTKFYYYIIFAAKHLGVFSDAAKGIAIQGLSSSALHNIRVPLIPLPEQRTIVDYLDEKTAKIDRMKADIEKQIGLLKEYKQRMISDAVTGKIEVRE